MKFDIFCKPPSVDEMTVQDMAKLVNRMSLNFQINLKGGVRVQAVFVPVFIAVEKIAEIDSCDKFGLTTPGFSQVVEQCKRGIQDGSIARYNNGQEMITVVKKYTVRPGQYSQSPDWWRDDVIPEVPRDFIFIYLVHDLDS